MPASPARWRTAWRTRWRAKSARGLRAGPELARARTILLEFERVWSHLNDIAAACSGTGLAAGNDRFAELAERARRLNAALTGHRFLLGTVQILRIPGCPPTPAAIAEALLGLIDSAG